MGFQIKIDTGTKSMFITHFGRHNKWIGKEIKFQYSEIYYYENSANYYSH